MIHGNLNFNGAKRRSAFPTADLDLLYTTRSGLDLIETKQGLNAKILPSCGRVNNEVENVYANKYIYIDGFGSNDDTGFIEFRSHFKLGNTYILFSNSDLSRDDRFISIKVIDDYVEFSFKDPGGTPKSLVGKTTNPIAEGWHTISLISNGSTWSFLIDGVNNPVTMTVGANTGAWFSYGLPTSRDYVNIGVNIKITPEYSTNGYIDYINYNNKNLWVITGRGKYIFDLIGELHLEWTGENHIYYDINASDFLLNNGYSIWVKNGEPDEYVPYYNGAPLLIQGFTGYAKKADYDGNESYYNYAPSLVDFNFHGVVNSKLDVFDKSNLTIHIDTSEMNYYDSGNAYRFRNDELIDPNVYNSYFNIGYKGFLMLGGSLNENNYILNLKKCCVTKVDEKGIRQYNLSRYCGISNIVEKLNGIPVYDDDGYIIFIEYINPIAQSIMLIGDSIVDSYAGATGVELLFSANTNHTINSIAEVGDQCAQQEVKWDALDSELKLSLDYVFVLVGQNDKAYSVSVFSDVYQSLINKIKLEIKPTCVLIASIMTPCRSSTNEEIYGRWLLHNENISGEGNYPIINLDQVTTTIADELNDGNDNLKAEYDSGDGLHPNTAGKTVIFNVFNSFIHD